MIIYKADFKEVIIISLGIFISLSIILFIKINTFDHLGYYLIVLFAIGHLIFSYFKNRVIKLTIQESKNCVDIFYTRYFKRKSVNINANELNLFFSEKVDLRGVRSKQILIRLGEMEFKISGEKEGWTNKKVDELNTSLIKLKELRKAL